MVEEFCSCERPLVLIGATRCEICNKLNYEAIHAIDKYCCSRCGRLMPYNQTAHDLEYHKFG